MYRRLFFLFPDKADTQKAVESLIQENISIKQMQVLQHKNPSASEEGISWTPSNLSLNV